MYFPWLGLFEQIRLADIYCHYDDVQLSRGFYNRVQLVRKQKPKFISVPIKKRRQKQMICESIVSNDNDWISDHRSNLFESLGSAPYFSQALSLFNHVHEKPQKFLHQINRKSILEVADYLNLTKNKQFFDSATISTKHKSSGRLLEICKKLEAKIYLTGHGALKYLDHSLFEKNGIEVFYIKYRFSGYSKDGSEYTPFVSSLDPISYLGKDVRKSMNSQIVNWRDAIKNPRDLLPKY